MKVQLIAALLLCIAIAGCKKDKPEEGFSGDFPNCRIIQQEMNSGPVSYTFDSAGRISTSEVKDQFNTSIVSTYEYGTGEIKINTPTRNQKTVITLNAEGNAVTMISRNYTPFDSINPTQEEQAAYQYENGYLTRVERTFIEGTGTRTYIWEYTWTSENITSVVSTDENGKKTTGTISYYTSRANTGGISEALLSFDHFTGKRSKLLLREISNPTDFLSYNYEYDASKKPVKAIMSNSRGGSGTQTFSWECL